jgi:O-antigen/teichoic acid export membrane protein
LVSTAFRLVWTGAFTACVAIAAHSTDLAVLMFGVDVQVPGDPIVGLRSDTNAVLIWSFLAVCTTYIFSTLLTAGERLRPMNYVFVAAIMLNICLNSYLLPRYEVVGAAISSVCTQWFVALGMVYLSWKYYGTRANVRSVIQIVLFMAGTVLCCWQLFFIDWDWQWRFVGVFLSGGICGLVSGWVRVGRVLDLTGS